MASTISGSENNQIISFAEKIKITTHYIFWLKQNKAVREGLSHSKIFRQECFLNMLRVIIAFFNLIYCLFQSFIPYSHHFRDFRSEFDHFFYLFIQLPGVIKNFPDTAKGLYCI